MRAMEHEWFTTMEAAEVLGVSRPTVQRLIEAGELRVRQRGLSRWEVLAVDVRDRLEPVRVKGAAS
jgi:excisionase family DNA binding protein